MEYASSGKANAALTTGIIGTSLGAIASAGGIGAILGVGKPHSDSDRPVTRYEMELIQANNAKETEIALLKSQQYTDRAMAGVQAQIGQQVTWNAVQGNNIATMERQLASITRFVVPSESLAAPVSSASSQSSGA
ncbi:MAG: hypothetical protein II563_09155 [Treponema sp.]|nr:hypothetical protein [Treponema sp.]